MFFFEVSFFQELFEGGQSVVREFFFYCCFNISYDVDFFGDVICYIFCVSIVK